VVDKGILSRIKAMRQDFYPAARSESAPFHEKRSGADLPGAGELFERGN
jgi:hypothetical protein